VHACSSRETWLKLGVLSDENVAALCDNLDVGADGARINLDAVPDGVVLGHNLAALGAVADKATEPVRLLDALTLGVAFVKGVCP
jgi:hypothetical protein